MASYSTIIQAVDSITATYQPLTVVLFGSHAYGQPTCDSDVDLLILKDFNGSPNVQADLVRLSMECIFPMDVLVCRPSDVMDRITENDFFLQEIMSKGLVLYASDNARVGQQSRRRLRRRLAAIKIPQESPFRYDLLSLPAAH